MLWLSHKLGNPRQPLAILGEGNASARLGKNRFLVKASGSSLGILTKHHIVECRTDILLALHDRRGLPDAEIDDALMAFLSDNQLFFTWQHSQMGCNVHAIQHAPLKDLLYSIGQPTNI